MARSPTLSGNDIKNRVALAVEPARTVLSQRIGRAGVIVERTLGPSLAWEACTPSVIDSVLADLRASAPKALRTATILHARQVTLPFYSNHVLVDVRLLGVAGVERALMLHSISGTHWLDGESGILHAVNELESLHLAESMALDYLRFFLFAMRGEHGAFVLIESADELALAEAAPAHGEKPIENSLVDLRALWRPLSADGLTDDGRFRARATVAYANGLFAAVFAIKTNGEIEMIDDPPLAALDGFVTPACPALTPRPEDPEEPGPAEEPVLVEALRRANDRVAEEERAAREKSDLPVTEAFVSVLLATAIRGAMGHRLLQRFNTT